MTVRHVLLDADGVLQELPGGWVVALEPWLGVRAADFLAVTVEDEAAPMCGDGDFLLLLGQRLREHGVAVSSEDLFAAVWTSIEVAERSVALVHQLRAAGYGVHLATNQERHRAAYMKTVLGYDRLFDVSCYSCDLGAAKPERAFFERALRLVAADPGEVLFVDDRERNVDGARDVGLRAERWHLDVGYDELDRLLAGHGVTLG